MTKEDNERGDRSSKLSKISHILGVDIWCRVYTLHGIKGVEKWNRKFKINRTVSSIRPKEKELLR
jgi:hypothetical protein